MKNTAVMSVSCFSLMLFLWLACTQEKSSAPKSVPPSKNEALSAAPEVADSLPLPVIQSEPFSLAYVMGKFDPATHPDVVKIDLAYANREGMYMRRDAYEAFLRMHAAALKDGIRLQIISAARNFQAQKGIWEAKWTGNRLVESGENLAETTPDPVERALKILRYSSMPGSSRHHWGTDIDLNDLSPEWFRKGEGLKIHQWLEAHGAEYGFCQPYSPKGAERPNGYNEEQWHWSYMPVARRLTELARKELKNDMIKGFLGAETAPKIGIVEKYVLGINKACQP